MKIYNIKADYVKFLHKYDTRVLYAPNKPDSYTENRPYIGIVFKINGMNYFAPFESYKPNHEQLSENLVIKFPKKNGLVSFNDMIPVPKEVLIDLDINQHPKKNQLTKQYFFCKKNWNKITTKAEQIYNNRTQTKPENYYMKNCCNYKNLEEGCREYCIIHNLKINKDYTQKKGNSVAALSKQPEKIKSNNVRALYIDGEWER